jgi:hypothetical protein
MPFQAGQIGNGIPQAEDLPEKHPDQDEWVQDNDCPGFPIGMHFSVYAGINDQDQDAQHDPNNPNYQYKDRFIHPISLSALIAPANKPAAQSRPHFRK